MKRYSARLRAARPVLSAALALLLFLILAFAGCAAAPGPSAGSPGEAGAGDTIQDPPPVTAPEPSPVSTPVPTPQPLPQDGRFSIPATNVSDSMLLVGGEVLESGGVWITDAATGRVMGLCEPMRTDRTPHGCRLYDLNGDLLWEDARVQVITAVLGRWAFVHTGSYDYDDGWAVDLDTGEERFRGCILNGEAAPGVFIVDQVSGATVTPPDLLDPPCLVNAQMEILRRFEGYATLGRTDTMGLVMPGYLVLYAADNSASLYDIARDEVLPGSFVGFVDPQQGLAQFSAEEGTAVFRLDTRERVSEWDTGESPRRYIAWGPDLKLYEQTNPQYRRQEYYIEQGGAPERILFAAYTAGGFYAERYGAGQLETTAQLLGADGRLVQALEPHNGAVITSRSWRVNESDLPNFTLRVWQEGYELIGKNGVLRQGETEGYAGLDCFSPTRYALYTNYCEESRFTLINEEGEVLLEGLDQLLPTEVPGIWAVQQGFTVGLMDENGYWLWSRDVSP